MPSISQHSHLTSFRCSKSVDVSLCTATICRFCLRQWERSLPSYFIGRRRSIHCVVLSSWIIRLLSISTLLGAKLLRRTSLPRPFVLPLPALPPFSPPSYLGESANHKMNHECQTLKIASIIDCSGVERAVCKFIFRFHWCYGCCCRQLSAQHKWIEVVKNAREGRRRPSCIIKQVDPARK